MPPHTTLTEADVAAIALAVTEQLKLGHACRFPEAQAEILHETAKRLSPDDIIAAAWLLRRLRGVADYTGRWVARLTLVGLVTLILAGIVGLGYAVKRGWISAP